MDAEVGGGGLVVDLAEENAERRGLGLVGEELQRGTEEGEEESAWER